jgi:glycosyltransferase A (GT-A) superfamily protein (DUF2064 family)
MPGDRTAILFFSHRPEREWRNKRFVQQDYATNRQVAEAFYEHTRQAVVESGFPVLEVTGAQQRGDSFGARLANAVADAFAAGYDRIIAVGSDCPTLHEVEWGTVTDRLDEGAPVLGPNPDEAGTYLIGLTRSQFDRDAFAALPWKTSRLFESLRRHLAEMAGTAPALLPPRDDVNGPADLRRLLHRSSSSAALVTRLRQVLGDLQRAVQPERRSSTRPALTRRSRAPPSSLTSNCPR